MIFEFDLLFACFLTQLGVFFLIALTSVTAGMSLLQLDALLLSEFVYSLLNLVANSLYERAQSCLLLHFVRLLRATGPLLLPLLVLSAHDFPPKTQMLESTDVFHLLLA